MNNEIIQKAILELKKKLAGRFGPELELFLFGSVARGEYDEFSDIDILVLVPGSVDMSLEREIIDESFEIELKYEVVFSLIIFSTDFWKSNMAKVMPLLMNVERESLRI